MGVLRRVLFACSVGILFAGPLLAQSMAEEAAGWGLLGTWALDCTVPASRSNAYLSYVREGDALIHRRDFGDTRDEHPIDAVKVLADGSLEIVITLSLANASQVRTLVLQKEGKGKMRAMMNRDEAGNYSIRDGKFMDGQPSAVQSRCNAATG